jgi:hypothetical protein
MQTVLTNFEDSNSLGASLWRTKGVCQPPEVLGSYHVILLSRDFLDHVITWSSCRRALLLSRDSSITWFLLFLYHVIPSITWSRDAPITCLITWLGRQLVSPEICKGICRIANSHVTSAKYWAAPPPFFPCCLTLSLPSYTALPAARSINY